MIGYLDCKMMVVGTKLYIAKEKLGANLRYGSYLAAVKTDKFVEKVKSNEIVGKVKTNFQETMDKIKFKKAEKSEPEAKDVTCEPVVTEETTNEEDTVETVTNESETVVVSEDKVEAESTFTNDSIRVEEVHGMDFSAAIEKEPVQTGPDFSLLRGVTYDLETDNLVTSSASDEPKTTESSSTSTSGKKAVGVDPQTGKSLYEVTLEDLENAFAKENENKKEQAKKPAKKK